ncbi:MAG: alpha/beta fold hydrolase [Firmicutes bacterium]|nr:alpha/beta fold hydrolase [Bacillota bacterium]
MELISRVALNVERPLRLVLLLHGRGADEEDLMPLAALFARHDLVLSVRAPYAFGPGYAWYGLTPDGKAQGQELRESVRALSQLIDQKAAGTIPTLLVGFSQGGLAAAMTASEREGRGIQGVVSLSAPPMPEVPSHPTLTDVPIFVGHGTEDPVVPLSRGELTRDILVRLGARVTFRRYPMGHMISEAELDDIRRWVSRLSAVESGPNETTPDSGEAE